MLSKQFGVVATELALSINNDKLVAFYQLHNQTTISANCDYIALHAVSFVLFGIIFVFVEPSGTLSVLKLNQHAWPLHNLLHPALLSFVNLFSDGRFSR